MPIHLFEQLTYSCSSSRVLRHSGRLFGDTESRHEIRQRMAFGIWAYPIDGNRSNQFLDEFIRLGNRVLEFPEQIVYVHLQFGGHALQRPDRACVEIVLKE